MLGGTIITWGLYQQLVVRGAEAHQLSRLTSVSSEEVMRCVAKG
jgi:hypothetical protein